MKSETATLHSISAVWPSFATRKAVGVRASIGVRWCTYADMAERTERKAARLHAHGIDAGERILLWGPSSPEWISWLFAAARQGVVVVPVDEQSSQALVTMIALETNPKLIVHGAQQDAGFLSLPAIGLLETEEAIPRSELPGPASVQPDDAAVIIFTSGTTTSARGVVLTHRNIMTQVQRFARWRMLLRLIPFRMLTIAPLSHVQGLILGACIPLFVGLTVLFVDSLNAAHLVRVIRDQRITLLATVPRVLQVMTRFMEQRPFTPGMTLGEKLADVRHGFIRRHYLFTRLNAVVGYRFWVILVGGAVLDRRDEEFWRDAGRFVLHGYGLTETAAIVSFSGPFSRRPGSIGRLRRNAGMQIAPDGELLVSGPHVSPGYFGHRAESASGPLPTGDLVRTEGGHLYFVGRKKQMLVTSEGFNVFPEEIEAAINRQPGVMDSAVIGWTANDSVQEVHAVLLLRSDGDPSTIVRQANTALEPHQQIRSWSVWPEPDFPRGSLLKVRRDELRSRLTSTAAEDAAWDTPVTADEIGAIPDRRARLKMLARYLSQNAPSESEDRVRLGADLGLGSLDTVELLGLLERSRNTLLDSVPIGSESTVGEIRRQIASPDLATRIRKLPTGQPAWSGTPAARWIRAVTAPVVVGTWSWLGQTVVADWHTDPEALRPPFLLAAAPHKHWRDAFAIFHALPGRLRRRLVVVTNRDFSEYFDEGRGSDLWTRLKVGAAYYAGLPLVFQFTIVPHAGATREGLLETSRLMDAGYCPVTFPKGIHFGKVDLRRHDPGVALLALETGIPILPVVLQNNDDWSAWPRLRSKRLTVHFLPPIQPDPAASHDDLIGLIDKALSAPERYNTVG